jgi:hypothetical protein
MEAIPATREAIPVMEAIPEAVMEAGAVSVATASTSEGSEARA